MPKLTFRTTATIASLICFGLAFIWMFFPHLLLAMWAVEFSYPVGLVGRRGAALFAGVGILLFNARNAEPSSTRAAIVSGMVFGCFSLAALGMFELLSGHAGPGILPAVAIEVALALAFLHASRSAAPALTKA
jgi:hypothetical protein